jgi:hypothetical protein
VPVASTASSETTGTSTTVNNTVEAESSVLNSNVNNTTNNNTIHVNVFGRESFDHLYNLSFEEFQEKIGISADDSTFLAFQRAIRMDPDRPENHSLRILDDNTGTAQVRSMYGDWNTADAMSAVYAAIGNDADRYKRCVQHFPEAATGRAVRKMCEREAQASNHYARMDYRYTLMDKIIGFTQEYYPGPEAPPPPQVVEPEVTQTAVAPREARQLQRQIDLLMRQNDVMQRQNDQLMNEMGDMKDTNSQQLQKLEDMMQAMLSRG